MSNNPYAPPRSNVTPPPRALAQAPPRVRLAVRMFWLALVVGLPVLVLEARQSSADLTAFVPLALIVYAFYALLIVQIGRGTRWARHTYLALTGFGIVGLIFGQSDRDPSWRLTLDAVSVALSCIGLYLTSTAPGSSWFMAAPETNVAHAGAGGGSRS